MGSKPKGGTKMCHWLAPRCDADDAFPGTYFHWVELIVAIAEIGNPAKTAGPKEDSKRPKLAKIEVSISPFPGPFPTFEPSPVEYVASVVLHSDLVARMNRSSRDLGTGIRSGADTPRTLNRL